MRAVVGPASAGGEAQVRFVGAIVGLVVVAAAFVLTWAAESATPPRRYWVMPFTELEAAAQDFQAHMASAAELTGRPRARVPVLYPPSTAPGVTATMHQGFAPSAPGLPAPGVMAW